MKLNLTIVFITMFLFIGCNKSDNFYNTKRIIETDKSEYDIGDSIQLTLKIVPLEKEKEIRIYENYKNLEISFSLINENEKSQNENWSFNSGKNLPKTTEKIITITKERPLRKTFIGQIRPENKNVILEFTELNMKVSFDKEKFRNNKIRIHGLCNPINSEFGASLEEYFETKDITINLKK